MKTTRLFTVLFTVILFLSFSYRSEAQYSITAGGTNYTQDFTSLGTAAGTWADNTTLTGWYARTDNTASIATIGVNTGSTTTAGLYSFGVAGTNPLTDRALGYAPSNAYFGASGVGKGYIGWRLVNNASGTISSITVTWTGEQYRKENNASAQLLKLYYQTGATVTSLVTGTWSDASSAFTSPIIGATAAAILDGNLPANRVANITVTIPVTIPVGTEIMLRWEDLNDVGNDHLLAIDDVTVNATISGALTPPTLVADATNNDVDHSMDITFTDDPAWRSVVTAVKVNNTALAAGDYSLTAGNLQLIPSNLNTLLTTAGSKTVSIEATGYNATAVVQQINVGAISAATSTATINLPLMVGVTRTVSVRAYDQYLNPISGYVFKYDAAVTNNDATTAESYTVDGSAVTATVSDVSLVTPTSAAGLATFPIIIPATVDANDGISVQVQESDGATNISTAFSYYKTPPQITLTGSDPTSNWFNQNTLNNILYSIKVDVANDGVTLNQLAATLSGTYLAADIATGGIKLRYSTNSTLETADATIGTLSSASTGTGEVLTFTGMTQAFIVGTSYLFITADIALTATINNTISGKVTANSDLSFTNTPTFSGGVFPDGNSHTIIGAVTMTELVVPKYIGAKTAASTNNTRTPFAVCLRIENLLPATTYDVNVGVALVTEAATVFGAGNKWAAGAYGTSNITNAFTTDATGNSGLFWLYIQPTGNATRFDAGQVHNLRLSYAVAGGAIPSVPAFVGTKTITALDVATTARTIETTDDGAFFKGTSSYQASGKFVLLFDNAEGTGDPLFSYQIRTLAPFQPSYSELPGSIDSVYRQLPVGIMGDYPAVIPIGANNPNGVRRIEARNADNTLYGFNTSADGIWPNGTNTTTILRREVAKIDSVSAPLVPPAVKELNLTLFLEGFYDAAGGVMNKAQDVNPDDYTQFDKFPGTVVDTISVILANPTDPWEYVYQAHGVNLNKDGSVSLTVPSSLSGTYYVVIKHRQTVETWSNMPLDFSSSPVSHNFTTSGQQAFGMNMQYLGSGVFGLYGGEITSMTGGQDGYIDIFDNNDVFNFSQTAAFGYILEDLTGFSPAGGTGPDGFVDIFDMALVFNNMQMAIGMNTPPAPMKKKGVHPSNQTVK